MIHRRELPRALRSRPIEPWTFVARTMLSRPISAIALPTIISDSPGRIDVSRVDEVDACIDCTANDAHAFVVIGVAPGPEHHCAEADRADRDAGTTKESIVHVRRRYPDLDDQYPPVVARRFLGRRTPVAGKGAGSAMNPVGRLDFGDNRPRRVLRRVLDERSACTPTGIRNLSSVAWEVSKIRKNQPCLVGASSQVAPRPLPRSEPRAGRPRQERPTRRPFARLPSRPRNRRDLTAGSSCRQRHGSWRRTVVRARTPGLSEVCRSPTASRDIPTT